MKARHPSGICNLLQIDAPIIQAPMAGVSTPAMAACVSNAGALGSIGVGAAGVDSARRMIRETRTLTARAFNVNVFCHRPASRDLARETAWLRRWHPQFAQYDAAPPAELHEIYTSFLVDDAMHGMLLEEKPPIVSFHFGLPDARRIAALRGAGVTLLATATNLLEARKAAAAGIDAIVAQGYEAGGHRGIFDTAALDTCLDTAALTRLLLGAMDTPVIAAGGIMTGADINIYLRLGAAAVQLGTAFAGCTESAADAGYRAALAAPKRPATLMTSVISGRPARCLVNRFTQSGEGISQGDIPDYPVAYDAGKALHLAARAKGEHGYAAHWAGTGVAQIKFAAAAEIVQSLMDEMLANPLR